VELLTRELHLQLGLGMDHASPRVERGPKLVGLLLWIVYGLCIQRVELDWIGP
jgi:hypothetical protein